MFKKFMCMTLSALLLLAPAGCAGGGTPSGSESAGGSDSTENPSESVSSEPVEPESVWNKEPTIKGTFTRIFSNRIDSDIWEVSRRNGEQDNNGTSPDNVFYSTDETRVKNAGATGGIAVLRSYGDLQANSAKRRQGAGACYETDIWPGKI